MNNGIKKKLEELIGEQVDLNFSNDGLTISYPTLIPYPLSNKVIGFESDDCLVLENKSGVTYIPIDHISTLTIKKK